MKKLSLILISLLITFQSFAQTNYIFKEASDLTLIGKLFDTGSNPYQRMDFDRFGGWTSKDTGLLKFSAGIAVVFKTDSPAIAVKANFTDGIVRTTRDKGGFDLYIKKDGKWLWAGCAAQEADKTACTIIKNMDGSMHECLMYLPLHSAEDSVKVGVLEGYALEAIPNPFHKRIVIHGSSFTHGSGTTRAGETYPAFFQRATGLDVVAVGVAGDCTMQPQFANAFKEAEFEAFIVDAFSNPNPETMRRNMFNFIETIQSTHPGVPIIFQRTIYRGMRHFNVKTEATESAKRACSDSLLAIALKKYKDVYVVNPCADDIDGDTSFDGTHPSERGYYLWYQSVAGPILKILAKYDPSLKPLARKFKKK